MTVETDELDEVEVPPAAYIGYTGSDREGKGPDLIERFLRLFSPAE